MATKGRSLDQSKVDHILASTGFIFPRTEHELDYFNNLYADWDSELKNCLGDPDKIFAEEEKKMNTNLPLAKNGRNKNTYFKRAVLAAEITSQLYEEPTFGHVKLQKLMFLCENIEGMNIRNHYSKQVAGPYDNKFMHSIDHEFKKQGWFNVKREKRGVITRYLYAPSNNYGSHRRYYNRYFSSSKGRIQWFIDVFKKAPFHKVELVATLYGCWLELIEKNQLVNDESLIKLLYDWSEQKKKFAWEDAQKAIRWMIENGVTPAG
ncbi:hypothetical protein [Prolixibacter denitrificans]|uniref:Uncharacterized protein n=1 Tax=Prolixibacter denitrificans TaxID=1541063 RepID=A0A2P8CHP7_9BACT|nr:hypothetical protein [Prolixibacter denitrificans]PSK84501.1 hypothetical protein CLV93_102289 [Prolixibacter denitrificans]GET20674.1 hypothetical protein JCM18694_09200 [Prolixibacter denitrificans]